MKKLFAYSITCGALLVFNLNTTLWAAETPAAGLPSTVGGEAVLTTITATIEAINHTTREITLKGPLGNTVTFTADPSVERLAEISVGDTVRADYYVSVATELRAPTEHEWENPVKVVEAGALAPMDSAPGIGGVRSMMVVATIAGVDLPTQTITVKGPMGNFMTARVNDPSNLEGLLIGEPIVVTFTEALAVYLEKVGSTADQ